MDLKIFYGKLPDIIEVTDICINKLLKNNKIIIPPKDKARAYYFGDPLDGVLKSIYTLYNNEYIEYDSNVEIYIDILNNNVSTNDTYNKLLNIHSKINLKYGYINEELPEQLMTTRYLTGSEKVLEIGGNIGRNSIIISHLLNDSKNLVVLESDLNISKQLEENRNLNSLNFYIEPSALSKRKIIQKGWETIPSDVLLDGYNIVNTITYDELIEKYNIPFDTIILDCEGAFYYILMDMPEILNNIKLIIMENDYLNIEHKNYVDNILKLNNFKRDYCESATGGWPLCCYNNFFEVWIKNQSP